jgi:prepilin-type N-terminal cleavage/methylation domain-containing protein
MKHLRKKNNKKPGFTIIEIVIVLAIVGLITAIVFVAVPEAQRSVRDSYRRTYARSVVEAMEEYYKNNGKFPGCGESCPSTEAVRFITKYLTEGKDPSTGESYNEPDVTQLVPAGPGAIATISHSTLYVYAGGSLEHNLLPAFGQLYIGANHWCYSSTGNDPSGTGPTNGPPLAGVNGDIAYDKFAVVIFQENGGYFCVDNFAKHTNSSSGT